jgi:site-specific recombinase XerD
MENKTSSSVIEAPGPPASPPALIAGSAPGFTPSATLPPITHGRATNEVWRQVEAFYGSLADLLEQWLCRRSSPHTRRAYRQDIAAFVHFLGLDWPRQAPALLTVTIADVLAFRQHLLDRAAAPKTANRRISSLSSLYRYLAGVAAELRLPVSIPNPAHSQFVTRGAADPLTETRALSATRARQLLALPQGPSLCAARDRAILHFYLYSGARLRTGCRLCVPDLFTDGDDTTIRLEEKGGRFRTIGLHHSAAAAIHSYIRQAALTDGPLFRATHASRPDSLAGRPIDEVTMWRLLRHYLDQLPGAGPLHARRRASYTPHTLRATTATLLLDAGVDITKVQLLLGHRHLTTTQIYDKRRRTSRDSASHNLQL